MKPGTPIPGLNFFKDQDPPVALERSDYPDWLYHLPQKSLAQLRRMPEEEATDKEKMRYLKLTRRMLIKQKNEAASANK
jgi:large subunit ribosomal protein L54